jgi:hypothetical protein
MFPVSHSDAANVIDIHRLGGDGILILRIVLLSVLTHSPAGYGWKQDRHYGCLKPDWGLSSV